MNPLTAIFKATSAVCEFIQVTYEIKKAWHNPSQANHFSLYTRLALSLLSMGEASAIVNDAKLETLQVIKLGEYMLRGINIPIQMYKEAKKTSQGVLSYFTFIIEGVIKPFAKFAKAEVGYQMYSECFNDMTKEERSKATYSIYEKYQNDKGIEQPVEECKKSLAEVAKILLFIAAIKIADETYYIISDPQAQAPQVRVVRQVPIVQEAIQEFDNLLEFSSIPPFLHRDPILSRFTCLITQQPIRHPVGDPNGVTLYEKSAIYQWLEEHNTSPMTGQPLTVDQLVEKPALQLIIDHRLTILQTMIEDKIKECEQEPSDAQLQSDTELENSQYSCSISGG